MAVTLTTRHLVTNACQGLSFLSAVCRLYTTFTSATHHTQDEDDTWQAAFKLSYELGCSVLHGTQALPPVHIDHVTSGSHLMRLTMQHQELVAAPTPVAGQGNCPDTLNMTEQVSSCFSGEETICVLYHHMHCWVVLVCHHKMCMWGFAMKGFIEQPPAC